MTPCNNCHGGEGTRPRRSELEWLTRLPGPPVEGPTSASDLGSAVPPDIACPAREEWPEALAQERRQLSGYPWWVRENFREALRRRHPGTVPPYLDIEDASLNLRLGLRHFTYNSSRRRETFHAWSTYATDINTTPSARLEFNLTVAGNQLPLERGLLALHGVAVDGPYFFNLSNQSRQAIFDGTGELCVLPQSLLADPQHGFLAAPNPHLTAGIVPFPELLNFGGGAWVSANLCFPMPTEFRSPAVSEAPLPAAFELNDLLGRVQAYREHHPPQPTGADSPFTRLYLASGRRLQNFLELLQPGSEVNLQLRDLQDLFLPEGLDLGPSSLNLRAGLNPDREVEVELSSLSLLFQAMGYARDPDTEEPRLLLDSARLDGPAQGPALRLRLDPATRELRALEAHLSFDAVLSLLQPALRGLQLRGDLELGLNARRNWAFAWNPLSAELPGLRLPSADPARAPTELSGTLRGGEATRELLGLQIPPGLRGEWNPAAGELHLEGNLILQGDIQVAGSRYEVRAPLAFYTTLRLGAGGVGPIPGSTALSISGLEVVNAEDRRELLRDGELFFSDDPEREVFREPRAWETYSLPDEILANHRSLPASLEFRGVWGNHHSIDLRGQIPVPLAASEPLTYDFSALLEDAAELHLDLVDLNPRSAPNHPATPHFNLIGTVLRAQRFPEGDGRQLWDFRLDGATATFGQGRNSITLAQPHLETELDRLELQAGNLLIRLPLLDLRANPSGVSEGRIRGPIQAHLNGTPRGGLELELDPQHRPLAIRNLDLGFSVQGLDVLPRALRRGLANGARFVGLDGHLEGHFAMNYPESPNRWNGSGDLLLRGDRSGDIYLLDSRFRRVGLPLFRDTRWRWRRIEGFQWRRGYALGDFHLETLLNPTPLFGVLASASQGLRAFGGNGETLLPGEIWAEMPYDNQPWTPRGFRNRIVDYVTQLCRQSPRPCP
ncbi:MAG: hypothetical protein U1F66_04430 [bacterium]